jgi:putative tryptophan/tyrosine transport system substrate-binding protein
MNRRSAIAAVLAAAAACGGVPLRAQPQAPRLPIRIGLLPDLDPESRESFAAAMKQVGWIEGREYIVETSGLDVAMHLEPVLTRMVPSAPPLTDSDMEAGMRRVAARNPELILATSTAYARVAQRLAPRIPVVMWTSGYPVEAGIAGSLAHPGGNVTGSTIYAGTGIWGKLLELLREVRPSLRRAGVLWDYGPPSFPREEVEPCHRELERAAQALGMKLRIVELSSHARIDAALAELDSERIEALVVTSGWEIARVRRRVMEHARRKRLPVAVDFRWRSTVEPYPLIVYGARQSELMQVAASYAVRILGGAAAGELPIQQPKRFELVINLRTAKQLQLAVPQPLLIRADEVVR